MWGWFVSLRENWPWEQHCLLAAGSNHGGKHTAESPGRVVAEPTAGGLCCSGVPGSAINGPQQYSCCSGSSPKRGMPPPRLSQGPDACQQLTHQETASPLFLPTFLPEHSPAQGVANPQKICWGWLTRKLNLPLDKKHGSAVGNLFVLGGAFCLSLNLPSPTPACFVCFFLNFYTADCVVSYHFFRIYVEQSVFKEWALFR